MPMTRDEAARAVAKKMGWEFEPAGRGSYFRWRVLTEQCEDRAWRYADFPAPDAPLPEKLAFTGRIAEAVFPTEGEVFHCGWVHGVLENCIEDARVKYDLSYAALLAALAALETR